MRFAEHRDGHLLAGFALSPALPALGRNANFDANSHWPNLLRKIIIPHMSWLLRLAPSDRWFFSPRRPLPQPRKWRGGMQNTRTSLPAF